MKCLISLSCFTYSENWKIVFSYLLITYNRIRDIRDTFFMRRSTEVISWAVHLNFCAVCALSFCAVGNDPK